MTSSLPMPDRVVLLHDYSQALGGASYLVQVLIHELRTRGIAVTFVAGDDGTNFQRDDVEFLPLHGRPLLARSRLGALTAGLYNPHAARVLERWIRRNDTPRTVYHLHGWSKILTPAVFGPLRKVSERLVLHGHDYFNCCPNGGFFNFVQETDCDLSPLSRACIADQCDKTSYAQKLWRTGREGLRRSIAGGVANANRILLIHPGQAQLLQRGGWPQARLKVVRNPVVPPCDRRVCAEDNRGVIFVGRISAEKGADHAAQAARRAGLPITFVGDGAEVERIMSINPDAEFLGRQNREGVARALRRARVSVMPSRWSEPFGLVALEAIGSGVPAIVSKRALMGEEIERAGFGRAIDTADVAAFATLMGQLHADDAQIAAMSHAGHSRYLELCNTPATWADAIVANYLEAMTGSTIGIE